MKSPLAVGSACFRYVRDVWKGGGAPPTVRREIHDSKVPSRRDQSSSLAQIVAVIYALVLGQSLLQQPGIFEHPLRANNRTTALAILTVFVGVAWEFLSYSLNMGRFPYRVRWTNGTSDTGTEEGRFAIDLLIALSYAGLLLAALRTQENPEAPLFSFFALLIIIDCLSWLSDHLGMFKWDIPMYRVRLDVPLLTGILLIFYALYWVLPNTPHQALANQLFLVAATLLISLRQLHIRKVAQDHFAAGLLSAADNAWAETTMDYAPRATAAGDRPRIYAAGPLGFTSYGRSYHDDDVLRRLRNAGFDPADPWITPETAEAVYALGDAATLDDLKIANAEVGQHNIELIEGSAGMLAILDGSDVDSGTASEIGYATARGKKVVGLRLDTRVTGDNRAAAVNLQVETLIERSGGEIVYDLDEAISVLVRLFP